MVRYKFSIMKYFFLIVGAVAIWLVSSSEHKLPTLADNYTLKDTILLAFGSTASIEDENIHISFDKVEDESRCPYTWDCAWEGLTNVRFTLKKGDASEMVELTQRGRCDFGCGTHKLALGYQLKLVTLTPYPNADFYKKKPLAYDGYQVGVVVSRKADIDIAKVRAL